MSPLKPVTLKTRRVVVVVVVALAALTLPVAAYTLGERERKRDELFADNCGRIHRVVRTLDQILINGRVSAARYERDGTITRVQLRRALHENDIARRKLYRADCPAGEAPALK